MKTAILNENSTEHSTIADALEDVYCQPTKGLSEGDKLERLRELGCDDDVFLCTNMATGETTVVIKHT